MPQSNTLLTRQEAITRIRNIHGDKYGGIDEIEYKGQLKKVKLICPEHGEFYISPKSLFKGCGCRQCAQEKNGSYNKINQNDFILRCRKVHGDKYDYSKVVYINSNTKICIICPEHGEFWQTPIHHLYGKQKCPKCVSKQKTTEIFITKSKNIHGNKYDYSKTKYINNYTNVCIICPEHGEFYQLPYCHLNRQNGCPKCAREINSSNLIIPEGEFIKRVKNIHGDKYDLTNLRYTKLTDYVYPICHEVNNNNIEHGEFKIRGYNFLTYGCPKCSKHNFSKAEKNICTLLSNNNIKYNENTREQIEGSAELDIFIPSKNIAIEYNGLYWHNEIKLKDKNPEKYHLSKTEKCLKKDIQLIHIFEDEWEFKHPIVESRLKSILGVVDNKIYARKCIIKEMDGKTSKEFLEKNHLQGNVNTKIRYGLYYNDELVSVMTFRKLRKNLVHNNEDGSYELLRFCNKLDTVVVGGASKLLKYFIKEFKPKKIISYADRRWSDGNLYKKLGFTHIRNSQPNYFYIVNKHRENRFKYRKSELVKQGFDKNKSEHQIMSERGIYRIYDCGTMVFEMNI